MSVSFPRRDERPSNPRPALRPAAWALGIVASIALRLVLHACRVRKVHAERDPTRPGRCEACVGGFWHCRLLPFLHHFRHRGIVILVSRSRDGELATGLLRRMGYDAVRGSSSRGGAAALRGMIEALRSGRAAATPVDGPRGPARVAKAGVVVAAQAAGVPLVPISWAADRTLAFRSWDRTLLPLPGARIVIGFGEPLAVPRDAGPDTVEQVRAEFERRLNALEEELKQELAAWTRGRTRE